MKRTDKTTATATVEAEPLAKNNGQTAAGTELAAANMSVILASLQTMRDGDFSVAAARKLDGAGGKDCRHIQRDCRRQPANGERIKARGASGR